MLFHCKLCHIQVTATAVLLESTSSERRWAQPSFNEASLVTNVSVEKAKSLSQNASDTQTLINYKYNCTVSVDVKGYSSKYVDKKIFFLQSLHKGAEKALDGMGRIHCRHDKKCIQSATHHSTLKKRQSSYIYTCKQNSHRKLIILVLNLF